MLGTSKNLLPNGRFVGDLTWSKVKNHLKHFKQTKSLSILNGSSEYLRTLPKTSPAGQKMDLCLELGKFRIHPISWIQKFFWGGFDCLDVPLEAT